MCVPGVSSGNTIPSCQGGDEPPRPTMLCLLLGADALLTLKDTSRGREGDEG